MTKDLSLVPQILRVRANGLEHRVLEWSRTAPDGAHPSGIAFLLHGYMDAAGTWDLVAPALARAGFRVLAPDMRGFGDGDRAPRGSYYHFADYVADVASLVATLARDEPVSFVGHSMGGVVATLYAGSFPEKVRSVANLEGLGPPDSSWAAGPQRMRAWIEQVRALETRSAPTPMTRAEARRRLGMNHPAIAPEVLDHRLPHLVRPASDANDADAVVWRFDPLHRTTSPGPFFAELFVEFAKKISAPVLFVDGGANGWHPADEGARLAAFPSLERATIEGAGHMIHWTRPEELATTLIAFLGKSSPFL
jgi:pimeloyl-ACP methyl ester carboxylesterase